MTRVWLDLPPRYGRRGPLYDVRLDDGELLIGSSLTPMLDAARALKTRGITGTIEMWDRNWPHLRMAADIEVAAGLDVREDRRVSPTFQKYVSRRDGVSRTAD